jgi:hypothetical protein
MHWVVIDIGWIEEADDAYEISRGFTLFDSKKDAEAHLDKEVTCLAATRSRSWFLRMRVTAW